MLQYLKMLATRLFQIPLLLSALTSGQSDTDSEIYWFDDGAGGYSPGVVNHQVDLRWFFGNGSRDREKDIHFLLYTRGRTSSEELVIGDADKFNKSQFDKTIPTKLIIHGFTNSDKNGFPPAARQTFLDDNNSPRVNLIIVDWGKLAQAPWYNEAAKNTQIVGVKVARFVEFLVAQGTSLDQIHLIGHSLGAHVCAFVGSNLKNMTLSRITALDPALPLFGDVGEENRIDPSDAVFVDVIHTAGGEASRIKAANRDALEVNRALAFIEPRGHADFYPNGGKWQPSCKVDFFGACSHIRAYDYYLESVINPKGFLSCECASWEEYKDGDCECSNNAFLGEQCSSSSKGMFFLHTLSNRPYAPVADQS